MRKDDFRIRIRNFSEMLTGFPHMAANMLDNTTTFKLVCSVSRKRRPCVLNTYQKSLRDARVRDFSLTWSSSYKVSSQKGLKNLVRVPMAMPVQRPQTAPVRNIPKLIRISGGVARDILRPYSLRNVLSSPSSSRTNSCLQTGHSELTLAQRLMQYRPKAW